MFLQAISKSRGEMKDVFINVKNVGFLCWNDIVISCIGFEIFKW